MLCDEYGQQVASPDFLRGHGSVTAQPRANYVVDGGVIGPSAPRRPAPAKRRLSAHELAKQQRVALTRAQQQAARKRKYPWL